MKLSGEDMSCYSNENSPRTGLTVITASVQRAWLVEAYLQSQPQASSLRQRGDKNPVDSGDSNISYDLEAE